MIMSPFVLDKNVPLIGPPRGGQIGADVDEPGRVAAGGGAGGGEEPAVAGGGCGALAAGELPASEAFVEAVSRRRAGRTEASQRGSEFASGLRCENPAEHIATGAGEVQRRGRRAFWANAGGRTSGTGRWCKGTRGDAAALDAAGRIVEPGAEAAAAPQKAGAQGTLWRDGADGRQL